MPFHTSFDDEARLVVLYYLSRGFSRNGILRLLIAKLSKHYTDFQVEKMIITHNLRQEEERKVLLYDTQRQGQEWDLDAVDGVISSLGSSLISGRAYELMIIERDDEMTVLNNEPERDRIIQNLKDMRMRSGPGHRGSTGILIPPRKPPGTSRSQGSARVQPYHRQVIEAFPTPRMAYDPARQQYEATLPPTPSGVAVLATGTAGQSWGSHTGIFTATYPTVSAFSPFAPGQPGGPPMSTCNPAILGTNSGGARGTFYGQNPSVGGSQVMHPDQNPPPIGGNGGDNGDEERGNRKRSGGEKGNSDDRGKIEKDKGRRKGKGRDGHN